jgi:hypothetical protein
VKPTHGILALGEHVLTILSLELSVVEIVMEQMSLIGTVVVQNHQQHKAVIAGRMIGK